MSIYIIYIDHQTHTHTYMYISVKVYFHKSINAGDDSDGKVLIVVIICHIMRVFNG